MQRSGGRNNAACLMLILDAFYARRFNETNRYHLSRQALAG
jgi:hypothetical protein